MLVSAMPLTDEIGLGMVAVLALWLFISHKRMAATLSSVA
jgi:hypothetical protein